MSSNPATLRSRIQPNSAAFKRWFSGSKPMGGVYFSRATGGQTNRLPVTIEVDGVQRMTTNSNGWPIYATEEGIRIFWRWFKDSKVVDKQGRPLVVYHGSNANFNVFDVGKVVKENGMEYGVGFYFSGDKVIAGNYGVVSEYYLRSESPFFVDEGRSFVAYVSETIGFSDKQYAKLNRIRSKWYEREFATDVVRGNKFDCIVADKKFAEVVVFEPTQIKIATENEGIVDAINSDICMSHMPRERAR